MADRILLIREQVQRVISTAHGPRGLTGTQGEPGLSAYEVAVTEGFLGTEDDWLASLIGDPGADGAPGSQWYYGTTAPSSGLGVDGDKYLRNTGTVYAKASGAWSDTGISLKGNTGAAGATGGSAYQIAVANGFVGNEAAWLASLVGAPGAAGAAGAAGSQWTYGSGVPSGGIDGDKYLRSTGAVYAKAAGVWTDTGISLKGDPGTDGTDGTDGADGAQGEPGLSAYEVAVTEGFVGTEAEWLASLVGDAGADGEQGEPGLSAYEVAVTEGFVGTEEEWLESLTGPPGDDGVIGSLWYYGSGVPSGGLGTDGDLYLRSTGAVYAKGAGAWSDTGINLKGATGDTGAAGAAGATGAAGSQWRFGVGVPDNSVGVDGDSYGNLATSDIYQRQSGVYVLIGNIKGPPGESGQDAVSSGTYLLSGGTVAWVSGYTYRIGAASYYINGVQYTSAEQTVAMDAADATLDRIDVIAFDATGPVKITGTPAANPVEPSTDPTLYLRRTIVYLPAASSAPSVSVTSIYAENVEWTTATSGGTIDPNSTSGPRTGSKCILGTAVVAGDYVQFTVAAFDVTVKNSVVLYIKPTAAWPNAKGLRLWWFNGSTQKGNTVTISNNSYGFNSQNTGNYMQIVVPLSAFALPAGTLVTRLRVSVVGGGASVGFRMDDIQLQAGLSTVDLSDVVRWRGTWASTTAYNKNDVVFYGGSSYIALQSGTGHNPASAATYWTVFAAAGANGSSSSDVFSYFDPDKPATSPNAQDDDFDSAASLAGYTAINIGAATVDVNTTAPSALHAVVPAGVTGLKGYLKALPAGDFVRWTKVRMASPQANYHFAGMMLSSQNNPAGTGRVLASYIVSDTNSFTYYVQHGNTAAFASLGTTLSGPTQLQESEIYLRIRRSSTTIFCTWSIDGKTWRPEVSVTEATLGATMAYWGPVFQNSHGSTAFNASWEFLRCLDGAATGTLGGTRNIGIAAILARGVWAVGTSYNATEAVEYNGSSYIALVASVGVTPGTDATKWMLLAEKGPPGDATNGFTVDIDGGGAAIVAGMFRRVRVPYGCTVTGWETVADQSGSIVVDVRKATYNGAFSSIAGTEKPTLASQLWNRDLALTTWTAGGVLAEGEWLELYVSSASVVNFVSIGFAVERTP